MPGSRELGEGSVASSFVVFLVEGGCDRVPGVTSSISGILERGTRERESGFSFSQSFQIL